MRKIIYSISAVVFTILFFSACEMEPRDNGIPNGVDVRGIKIINAGFPFSRHVIGLPYTILKTSEQKEEFIYLSIAGYLEMHPELSFEIYPGSPKNYYLGSGFKDFLVELDTYKDDILIVSIW